MANNNKESISKLVQDKEWQKVRSGLVGKWNLEPEECCKKLQQYLGPIHSTTNDKIRIVMNYLTGTGFRIGRIKHHCIDNIKTQLSVEIKKRKSKGEW